MTALRKSLTEYLALRRALGFKMDRGQYLLSSFVEFMELRRRAVITIALAVEWAKQPADAHPTWWSQKLSAVRVFARHLHVSDSRHAIPGIDVLPRGRLRSTPFLYSEAETRRLLFATRSIRSPFLARTYEALFGLLAATGMRVGEAIRLDQHDVEWRDALLVVRHTKFGKSREIVLHPSVLAALRRYATERDRVHPRPRSKSFFVSLRGTRLIYNNVHRVFPQLLRIASISARRRPRIHDLRHAFAVRVLLRWYHEGADVDARMPVLSTYLGHADPSSTYWYLSASPELMALAARKLERSLKELP